MSEAEESLVQEAAADEPSVFRQMYRITADREATFEEKIRRLIDLGREHLGLPYGFMTRIEQTGGPDRESSGAQAGEAPDPDSGIQKVVYASGDHPLLQPGETCPLSEAYCRKTIHRRELLAVQNAPTGGWQSDPAYERFELGAYIGSRIVVEGELYGTFCFASPEARDRPFSEDEEALVELLTRWASYELERQRSRERIEQFAELVTHDLRNPLSAAQMNVHMVRRRLGLDRPDDEGGGRTNGGPPEEDEHNEKLRQHLDVTERALDRMEAIITDTLALAHGEQHLGPDDLESLRLGPVVETCWEQVNSEEATIQKEAARPQEGPSENGASGTRRFLAHEGRLRQLLENLFRNAIDHGGPSVTVTVGRTEDGFFVADDGPGIPPEKREKIFETSYSTREGGTGLGLSIARAVATAHGWTLSVSESADGGARFEVTGVRSPE